MSKAIIRQHVGEHNINTFVVDAAGVKIHGDCWKTSDQPTLRMVWLHGWGQDRYALQAVAMHFTSQAEHYFLDIPGFGESPVPQAVWGAQEYADAFAEWLQTLPHCRTIVIGLSVGGRLGLRLTASHKHLVDGLILLASHGLHKKRSIGFKLKAWGLRKLGRTAGWIDRFFKTRFKEVYRTRFGSEDYRQAGAMRSILVKMANENEAASAGKLVQPVLLVYGAKDQDTPIAFGRKFHTLINDSKLIEIPDVDHDSLIIQGRAQVQTRIADFLNQHFKSDGTT
ncbi:MAG: alpha/beta hydrolase [Gammaproteobacteria bacterium]|nr:alpha/beta hydrolase [Gammaproteobacteria bacterium]